jgi:hypothetical protein
MFIADKHLDQSHIRAMIAALPKLQPMISVLFLEAFYHDQDPRGITDIAAHLNERSFNWTNTLATDLSDLISGAASRNIQLKGIDFKVPSTYLPKAPSQEWRRTMWRTAPGLAIKWVARH